MKKKAFTLIELLVVIAIIAILAVLIILALNTARLRARDSSRRSDLRSVTTGLELYNDTVGTYPDDTTYTGLVATIEGGANNAYGFAAGGMPHDPSVVSGHADYGYNNGNNAVDYVLGAQLEGQQGTNDTECPTGGTTWTHCVGTDLTTLTPAE
jgi:prepilin-type N-terminal cleavage/methylation domain-containing protein